MGDLMHVDCDKEYRTRTGLNRIGLIALSGTPNAYKSAFCSLTPRRWPCGTSGTPQSLLSSLKGESAPSVGQKDHGVGPVTSAGSVADDGGRKRTRQCGMRLTTERQVPRVGSDDIEEKIAHQNCEMRVGRWTMDCHGTVAPEA